MPIWLPSSIRQWQILSPVAIHLTSLEASLPKTPCECSQASGTSMTRGMLHAHCKHTINFHYKYVPQASKSTGRNISTCSCTQYTYTSCAHTCAPKNVNNRKRTISNPQLLSAWACSPPVNTLSWICIQGAFQEGLKKGLPTNRPNGRSMYNKMETRTHKQTPLQLCHEILFPH